MKYDHLCHLKNSTYPHLYVIMSMVSYIPHNIQKCVYKALLLHICTSSAQSLACPSLAPLGRARSLCAVAPLRLVAPNGRRFPPVRRSLACPAAAGLTLATTPNCRICDIPRSPDCGRDPTGRSHIRRPLYSIARAP